MLKNYFKVAMRHLMRSKGITFINIAGLAIGMACCILIVLFVKQELTYNDFHTRSKETYRVVYTMKHQNGELDYGYNTQFAAAPAFTREISKLKEAVRVYDAREMIISSGAETYRQENVLMADADFFKIFSFPLLAGNAATVLKEPYTAVLSASTARKYFGSENPVGKPLRVQDDYDCMITGVAKDAPANSDIQFDVIISFKTMVQNAAKNGSNIESSWFGFSNTQTFVTLAPGMSPAAVRADLDALTGRYITPIAKSLGEEFAYYLQPLANIHLRPEGDLGEENGATRLYLYSIIGFFIILIACINFMNLVTARGHERAMEVGLRKVMGAERKALIMQFLVESVLISLLAFFAALLLAQLLLPGFNYATDKTLSIFNAANVPLLGAMLALSIVVGLLAGSYPALYLSGFIPVRILKGGNKTAGSRSLFRKVLVVSQFSIAIALIIATVVIYSQLRYMQRKNLGYDQRGLVNFYLNNTKQAPARDAFKAELERLPFVQSAAYTSMALGGGGTSVNPVGIEGSKTEESKLAVVVNADFSFFTNIGARISEGRDFDTRFPTDSTDAFVINRQAAKAFGLSQPVGSRLEWRGGPVPRKGTVIGVVEDFNVYSLRLPIQPMVAMIRTGAARVLTVRLVPGDRQQQLAGIGDIWRRMMPAFPYNYRFVEFGIEREYDLERRTGSLFGAYACLAVFIASMGLFGLAMLVAKQRTKEIGIRKVLGASVTSIMTLLSRDFLLLVFIAIFIAAPIAWYAADKWLQNFAFPIGMPWWAFAAAGAGALLIAFVTISFQAVKAALLNPVRSLRSE